MKDKPLFPILRRDLGAHGQKIRIDRRKFVKGCSALALALGWPHLSLGLAQEAPQYRLDSEEKRFIFGASAYPDIQRRDDWLKMLDCFADANFTTLRLAESSWGNVQVGPKSFEFEWLRQALDDVHERGISAILGTSTYIAPQWLIAMHPEIRRELQPGIPVHGMGRKAACINHPVYRAFCRLYITELARAFRSHPAVIGWQLDNEIETELSQVCYNRACESAWQRWLSGVYGTAAMLNERWDLSSWGMRVEKLSDVPQVYETVDPAGIRQLPMLNLANLHFRRDCIFDFFQDQKTVLRNAGARQWITTDWNDLWTSLGDDPRAKGTLDIEGLNFYPSPDSTAEYWNKAAWQHDLHRSGRGHKTFIITETTAGVYGGTSIDSVSPSREQFRMWALQPVAFGACGILYWSANRWRGGPWPQWGSLMDWSGKPEAELAWVKELGEFLKHWGAKLSEATVESEIALITDFDQRATLASYPEVTSSQVILSDVFHCAHRLGIGIDTVNSLRAGDSAILNKYRYVILAADCVVSPTHNPEVLLDFVRSGGQVLVTPINGYQTWDGVFVKGALGSSLRRLTGTVVESTRRTSLSSYEGYPAPTSSFLDKTKALNVGLAMDGFWEKLACDADVNILAQFRSNDPTLNGNPSISQKKIGKGSVTKLAFWPKAEDVLELLEALCGTKAHGLLSGHLASEVQGVPRTDGSLFLVNTSHARQLVKLAAPAFDRITGRTTESSLQLKPFAVTWLEPRDPRL